MSEQRIKQLLPNGESTSSADCQNRVSLATSGVAVWDLLV
jgi:hypothetical protein